VSGRKRRLGSLVLVLLSPFLCAAERPPGLGDVKEVRTWSYPDYTRVVVELTRSVETEVERLGANARAGRGERLYADLPGIWVGRRFLEGVPVGDGLLQGVRMGQNTLRRSRLVIDLQHYQSHRLLHLRNPDRVVIDVYGRRSGGERREWPDRGQAPGSTRLSAGLRRVDRVVIDAGHGGRDPGAIGIGGLKEKDINLKLAHLLRAQLEKRGFEVVMTREKDQTLGLEKRTAHAESSGGDLFVSLHANAARRRAARGLEIYYLDANHERHTLDVAARENGVGRDQIDSLQRTLAKLRVAENGGHSAQLAELVHDEVEVALLSRGRGMPNLGVKKGPFYVLFLSSMPSILVEAGFVTNKQDAKLLRSRQYLSVLADEIADGIERYRDAGTQVALGDAP